MEHARKYAGFETSKKWNRGGTRWNILINKGWSMNEDKFKETIYGPYKEAWKVIKILQEASEDNPQLCTVLHDYMKEVDEFFQKYEGNEFAMLLRKMMLSADDAVMKIGRQ